MVVEAEKPFLFTNYTETGPDGSVTETPNWPNWVQGELFMPGCGKFHFEDTNFSVVSIQDAFTIFAKITFADGKATLHKKFQDSEAYRKALAAGKPVLSEVFTKSSPDVTKSRIGRILSFIPESTDNANHIIYNFGKHIIGSNGLNYFTEINAQDLTTIKRHDSIKLFGSINFSPHPLMDKDGTLYNVVISVGGWGAKLSILRIPAPTGNESSLEECLKSYKTIANIPMPKLGYTNAHHSFGMTENYIITIEQPFLANVKRYAQYLLTGTPCSVMDIMEWTPEMGNKFHVTDKRTGKVLKTVYQTADPFFVIHVGPCFERTYQGENGLVTEIVMDFISYDSPEITKSIDLEVLRNQQHLDCTKDGYYRRFVIPLQPSVEKEVHHGVPTPENEVKTFGASSRILKTGKQHVVELTPGTFSKGGITCQTINPKFNYRNYRYCYGSGSMAFASGYYGTMVKFDLETGTELAWKCEEAFGIFEALFLPHPQAGDGPEDEDNGVLMIGVFYAEREKNAMVLLDAKTMTEITRVTFKDPLPPFCHAVFIPRK